ncbi:MAG: FtsQ-type POTRA domain-containing protein [Clostridiales bacterium]|nr:FtsQ-type POTRA domain-containing protein [Clostridiales bacterium]
MDDSELDRLFGKEDESSGETLKEDDKVSDKLSEDKAENDVKEKKPKEKTLKKPKEKPEEKSEEKQKRESEEPSDEEPEEVSEESGKDSGEKEEGSDDAGSSVEKKDEAPQKKTKENKKEEEREAEEIKPSPKLVPKKRTVQTKKPVRKEDNGIKDLREMIPLSGKSILAIALALAVVIMVVLVLFLPAFRVRNTHVEGNVVLTDQEILKAAGLEYDAHLMSGVSGNIIDILRLDYGKTEQKIKKENPYIEDIRITIKLPSTVDITVRERSKVCYIRTPDGYAALDRDGIVLELSSSDAGRKVQPVICGLNVKYAELGKPVKIDNIKDYKKAIIVLGAILAADNASVGGDYSMFENTSEVRILPSGYIFLTIYSPSGNLIQIKLNGTDSIGDDMAWLLYAFNADAFDKVTVDGALDMTGDEYIFDEYD